MEILIRLVDGKLTLAGNALADKVQTLGMLELAKVAFVSQSAPPPIQVPGPALARQLVGHNGHAAG